jgi:hypothetical protein
MGTRRIKRLSIDQWPLVMAKAKERFPPGNPEGVFACGISEKVVGGIPRGYLTLVVHVRRKLRTPVYAIPEIRFHAAGIDYAVKPDVVAVGAAPGLTQGGGVVFSGLHLGAPIVAGTGRAAEAGGVACFLTDNGADPTHFVTAGHLFAPGAGIPVFAGAPGTLIPIQCGVVQANLLEESTPSTFEVDAALVRIVGNNWFREESPADAPNPTQIENVVHGQVYNTQAYLPTAFYRSNATTARLLPNVVYPDSGVRSRALVLEDVVWTAQPITQPGDSGTILFERDPSTSAVGSCIGRVGMNALFEPLCRSIALFARSVPGIRLWRRPA